jgi:excisionase family DNA binding protein
MCCFVSRSLQAIILCFALFPCVLFRFSVDYKEMHVMRSHMSVKFYTIEEVAAILRVHHTKVRQLVAAGEIQATKVGKQYRISEEALQEYIARNS